MIKPKTLFLSNMNLDSHKNNENSVGLTKKNYRKNKIPFRKFSNSVPFLLSSLFKPQIILQNKHVHINGADWKKRRRTRVTSSDLMTWRFCFEIEGKLHRFVLLEKAKCVAIPIPSFAILHDLICMLLSFSTLLKRFPLVTVVGIEPVLSI
jgi:hypothetical protein